MRIWKRVNTRWVQFRHETVGLIRGFQMLMVSLALIGQVRLSREGPILVIVDSWREALLLWFLWMVRVLPRYRILVVRRAQDLDHPVESDFYGETMLIATSRVFTKHYQIMAELRHQQRLVVI